MNSRCLLFGLCLIGPALAQVEPAVPLPPVVAGLARDGLAPRVRGLVLLGELGCVGCHHVDAGHWQVDRRRGPDLVSVGSRVQPDYLRRFLADPHGVEPGTTMPDLLRGRATDAEVLAHYLRSFAAPTETTEAFDELAAQRGRELFGEIGCVACHAPRDAAGNELPLPDSEPLAPLEDKYHMASLSAFLLAPHETRPAARMPNMLLSPREAHDLSSYLLARATETHRPDEPVALDATKVAAGRARFAALACANCHDLDDPERAAAEPATPLRQLDPARGCMSGTAGPWPFYPLSDRQRADLTEALRRHDEALSDEQRIRQRLVARNCVACHERGELGGVSPERSAFFTTYDESLGKDGRVPPPLTGVGAKLQPGWLHDAIAHGQSERPYLATRMPGFGIALGQELAELFERTDRLPPIELAPLPTDRKAAKATRALGRELVGADGMSCITCHTFAGERAGAMGAIDLVATTAQRLRREWFTHFLHAPARFRPATLMPQFFVEGKSVRPEIGDGDAAHQIDAIWHYLAEGRNVPKPNGMRHPPIELEVGDQAVILRRSVQNTGKRGISVGYPAGVNLTFDAEHLGLNQIWWGKFVDAAGVWTGQGSGEARILGEDRVMLPNGPAFVVLPDPAAPWPERSRRELGQRFLGYDLDARGRPAFRYACDGVMITDTPHDVSIPGASRPILRRTLTFESAIDQTLTFRAARAGRADDLGDGVVRVGSSLRIHLPPGSFAITPPAGDQRELRVTIPIHDGHAELVLDYHWQEKSK